MYHIARDYAKPGDLKIRVRRQKRLRSFDDLVDMLRCKKTRVLVLAGAGISVSANIPDFRSEKGIYNTLDTESMGLSQPEELFDIHFFQHNPVPFFTFAKSLLFGKEKDKPIPTPTHRFVRRLEKERKLRRMYTQNIDGLESRAGIKHVVYCHGSLTYATCLSCKRKVHCDELRDDISKGRIPYCVQCKRGLMKPNIKFFGEKLDSHVGTFLEKDKGHVDLIFVFGTSLKVAPISHVLDWLGEGIPRVLINRERVDVSFDLELLGDCDVVVQCICDHLDGKKSDMTAKGFGCSRTLLFKNAVVPSSSSNGSSYISSDESFVCDACSCSISNQIRYHCMSCFDYDLCLSCVRDRREHERHRKEYNDDGHTFKKMGL